MINLDDVAPSFRRACERWPDAPLLRRDHDDLAATLKHSGNSALELCKAFVESVCRTILEDLNEPTSADTTGGLMRDALTALGLENTRGASKLDKVFSAYNKLAEALNDARNEEGSAAHGRDGFLDALSDNQRRVYVLVADSMLHLLLSALDGQDPDLRHTREPYSRFERFNRTIDTAVCCSSSVDGDGPGCVIRVTFEVSDLDPMDIILAPSQLLFAHDRDMYVEIHRASGPHLRAHDQEVAS
jgi:hypothetical protein